MKKLALFGIIIAFGIFLATSVDAAVSVKGYYRKNGTYVQPHYRSNPDGNPYNNYSFPGNTNPYTGKVAPGNVDTYLNNYYNSSSGSSTLYSTPYSTPYFTPYSTPYATPYITPYIAPTFLPQKDVPYVVKNWVENNPGVSCDQSTFLRSKEKKECISYKELMYSYKWNVTANEFDGKRYVYDPVTKVTSACSDGYKVVSKIVSGKTTLSCAVDIPTGCMSTLGYSVTTGLSCSDDSLCAPGMFWSGNMCL